jgi:hypothetical protein
VTRRGAALLAAVLVAPGCGGADGQSTGRVRLLCEGVPPATDRHGPVAIPRPVSPEGAAASWTAEYWEADVTLAEGGLCVISETQPGTFALTGVVVDAEGPVHRARVAVEALPSSPATALEVLTDERGAFAFVNVPVRGEQTCYRTTITASGRPSWIDLDWMAPGEYAQSIELDLPRGPIERFCTESS